MGKWCLVALMCLMVGVLACSLAFGQGPEIDPVPSAEAGPGQIVNNPLNYVPPGADALPLGHSRDEGQKAANLVLTEAFAPKNHTHPGYALKGHGHGNGAAATKATEPSAMERQVANNLSQSQAMYVYGGPQGWTQVQPGAAPASNAVPPQVATPGAPGPAANPAPQSGASGGNGMTPIAWAILAVVGLIALVYALNQRTNRDADARAEVPEERRRRAEERAERRRDEDDAAVRYGTRLASAGYGAKPGIQGPLRMRAFMIQRGPDGRADGVEWYETAEGRIETVGDQDVVVMDPGRPTRVDRRPESPARGIEEGPSDRVGTVAQGGQAPRIRGRAPEPPDAVAAAREAGEEA